MRPTRLFTELDAYMGEEWESSTPGHLSDLPSQQQARDYQIDQTLRRAVRAFSARWLPLIPREVSGVGDHEEEIRQLWRASRKDMLRAINRVSYRSVITLFLFGLTPIPNGISDDEEMEGLTGQICVQTALQQVQRLRERQRNCQFSGAKVSPGSDALAAPTPASSLTQEYLAFESRAYWCALMFDTSGSLTLNFRSSLTAGLNGFTSEPAWRLVKMWLAGSFHSKTEEWRTNGFELTDDSACQVIAAAAACKLYVWKMIAVLKEALREGVEEEMVTQAWTFLMEGIEMFKVTIRPLLRDCERRLPFLGQLERINWYETVLHYYLGILILVDAVEAAERTDLLSELTETRLDAEHEAINALKFGLESQYTIYEPATEQGTDFPTGSSGRSITASFVAVDPYPHHVVASVRLMNKVVCREYQQGKIKYEAYSYLSSTLLKALEQLPQSSKSVQAARQYLHLAFRDLDSFSTGDTIYGISQEEECDIY
ncbi:uncharacterized protein A1O9_06835 [Exophiala aquamarina CBS 119918]|uniref:Transcription factor domain-containing protein n=1 Tax=Exophiala aquamarina CBS 119918 TaxID=1182545 RepID=A0A072P9U5_9EURO|nr:uncharacterized protein A1O9_06835 [Exophiala aquamarina CBS 119918]KEF56646.1 hypothetical protein A1O9_06835 [Exophiala aquamarina CBS 119918]